MTELEALKRMREMANEWSGTNVLMSVLDAQGSNMDDAAAIQEQAIDLVDALILRMQEAEANPAKGYQLAERELARLGSVAPAYIEAKDVREWMRENGRDDLADDVSDMTICMQIEIVLSKVDLPIGWGDWTSEVVNISAERLMQANPKTN